MKKNKKDYTVLIAALIMFGVFLLSVTSVELFGQSITNDASFNINANWVEAELHDDGAVHQIVRRRGGVRSMEINNNEIVSKGAFTCGFGSMRTGQIKFNQMDSLLVFDFNKEEGYMNNETDKTIYEVETYKILRATSRELILKRTNKMGDTIAFLNKSVLND